MKKVLAILLAISVLALSACAARQTAPDTQDTPAAETTGQPDASEQAGEEQASEEQQPAQEAKRIEPLPESLDLNALTDATVAASFGADDISETDGKTELTLTVYDYDIYDMVDIAQLAVGDTIVGRQGHGRHVQRGRERLCHHQRRSGAGRRRFDERRFGRLLRRWSG